MIYQSHYGSPSIGAFLGSTEAWLLNESTALFVWDGCKALFKIRSKCELINQKRPTRVCLSLMGRPVKFPSPFDLTYSLPIKVMLVVDSCTKDTYIAKRSCGSISFIGEMNLRLGVFKMFACL
jgi:hypothetical protein